MGWENESAANLRQRRDKSSSAEETKRSSQGSSFTNLALNAPAAIWFMNLVLILEKKFSRPKFFRDSTTMC